MDVQLQREEKIAAAKRRLRQFKQKRNKPKKSKQLLEDQPSIDLNSIVSDDTSSIASEDAVNPQTAVNNGVTPNGPSHDFNHENAEIKNSIDEPKSKTDKTNNLNDKSLDHLDNNNGITHKNQGDFDTHSKNNSYNSDPGLITSENNEDMQEEAENNASLSVNGSNTDHRNDTSALNSSIASPSTTEHERSGMATAESLLQISNKLNGIAAEAQSVTSPVSNDPPALSTADQFLLSELETRNQHLADQVSSLTRQKQELQLHLDKLNQQINDMHVKLETEKHQIHNHGVQEQTALRQQLQVQMQTIGILVAEKQELLHQVNEVKTAANRDHDSLQRAQDQLQDLKQKLQNLERDGKSKAENINLLTTTKSELERERDQLQLSVNKFSKSNEEHKMLSSELTQKLVVKESECSRLNEELADLNEKLSMAEVLLQQLSSPSSETPQTQLDELQEENKSLHQKLNEYQASFEQLAREREQFAQQYQQINNQLQQQVAQLSEEVGTLHTEKDEMMTEQENLRLVIRDLKEANQELGCDQDYIEKSEMVGEMSSKVNELQNNIEKLCKEKEELNAKLGAQLRNNEHLARLNEEQEQQLIQLNEDANDSKLSSEEHARMLEQAHSDKTTISRALMQNKQLKHQLEEMHEGFVKLSNDKMQLASHLSTFEHKEKELLEEIEKYKNYIDVVEKKMAGKHEEISQLQNTVRQTEMQAEERLSSKQREMVQLQNAYQQVQYQLHSNQQSATQTTNSSNLQEELSTSLETINLLREQNGELKSMISNLQKEIDQTAHPNNEPATQSDSNQQQQVPPPGELASLNQVMAERDFLTTQIEEHKQERHKLLDKLHALQNEKKNLSSPESDPGYQDLSHNMSLLQDRFATVMRAKVEAESRVEDLEHINLQLQNECDTIGEYITLYHNQRQLLKQRHNEKDEYVSSMAQEREAMQQKLEKLQSLVLSLLSARESAKNLTSTPHRRKLDPKIDDSVLDGLSSSTSYPADWPDMLEDEEARQPTRPDILPEDASLPSHGKNRLTLDGEKSLPGKLERLDLGTEREDATATQIISLLEQMQKPTFPTPDEAPRGFCLRYSGRYTAV